ncbi:HAMP domain-containing sensor histidine kinase [Aggregatilineales bacterium SYSU G02658]
MAELNALTQAQAQLNELLEAARQGAIIPIRLPGQLEAIASLLAAAQAEHEAALREASAKAPADLESYMQEEAYFVGHAIHELRTPMTSIRGYSDMLGAMGELNDMQKQFLGTIKLNARRMESLMIDVSTMNKLRKNTLKLSPKMDMFKNIAMRLEKDFTPLANELNRQLVFDVPSGLPILNIDSDLLVQALGKLIENGLRYSPAETGIVTVRGAADGSDLVISISDNGIGMSDEELAKLGTIYFRSENDTVREFKGSGLGIPVAFGLIQKLGGSVHVESTPNVGTTFHVRLPGMA